MRDTCLIVVLCLALAPVADADASESVRISACDSSDHLQHGTLLGLLECVSWIKVPAHDWIESGFNDMSRRMYGSL